MTGGTPIYGNLQTCDFVSPTWLHRGLLLKVRRWAVTVTLAESFTSKVCTNQYLVRGPVTWAVFP